MAAASVAPLSRRRPMSLALAQLVFAVLVSLDLLLRFGSGAITDTGWPTRSAVGLLAALVLAAVLAEPLLGDRAERVSLVSALAVLDIAAVGLARLDQPSGTAALVVLPALYLGRWQGRRGVTAVAVACLLFVVLPGWLLIPDDRPAMARAVLASVVAVAAALAMRRMLTELAREQRTSVAIVESAPVGLSLVEPDGYRTLNPTQERLMRLAFGDPAAADFTTEGHFYEVDGVTVIPPHLRPSQRLLAGEDLDDVRMWVGANPEQRRALSISGRVIRDERHRVVGAAMAANDITGFLRAIEAQDAFVASVSHELRTPLTSISGYALLLLEDEEPLDPAVEASVRVILRNARRLDRLVGELLDTAQADAHGPIIEPVAADLARVVADVVESAQPTAASRSVRLATELPDSLVVEVDPHRMAQVVENLTTNALKHTRPGGDVLVSLRVVGGGVVLAVADNGAGIDAAEQEQLFERFFRTHASRTGAVPGVGLGLSLVHGIVTAHGGGIEVDSTLGVGSTFTVRIPQAAPTP